MSDRAWDASMIQAVADHALAEADEIEVEIHVREKGIDQLRRRAQVLRDMHALALPHAREATLSGRSNQS